MRQGAEGFYYCNIKRVLDIIIAGILLLPSAILILLSCIAIRIETGESAFFIQERPGYKGKIFRIFKLRTMIVKTENNGKLLTDMERMTKVGKIIRKLSIDELPQILNILMGTMSFIGPRPLLVQYLALYTPEQMKRHDVRPGISGWAQVNGRNELTWEQKFNCDVWYVEHVSLWLDIKIFGLTIINVFRSKGVNQSNMTTMQGFNGNSTNKIDLM